MVLKKTTHVDTESGGRIEFTGSTDRNLELTIVSSEGVVLDKAELSQDDLYLLIKEFIPHKKRGPRPGTRKTKEQT
jgi:hypothetical protein